MSATEHFALPRTDVYLEVAEPLPIGTVAALNPATGKVEVFDPGRHLRHLAVAIEDIPVGRALLTINLGHLRCA